MTLEVVEDGFLLEVRDDGVGFDPEQVSPGHGLGNIETRATVLGALLVLESEIGGGTVLRVERDRARGREGA